MARSKYLLKQGVLLQAFSDSSKTCTNANLTDELAEWHLKNNPACRKYFAVIPTQKPGVPPLMKIIQPKKEEPVIEEPEVEKPEENKETEPEETIPQEVTEDVDTEDDMGTAKPPVKRTTRRKPSRKTKKK